MAKLYYVDFANKIKALHPELQNQDPMKLATAVLAKHPYYEDKVSFEPQEQGASYTPLGQLANLTGPLKGAQEMIAQKSAEQIGKGEGPLSGTTGKVLGGLASMGAEATPGTEKELAAQVATGGLLKGAGEGLGALGAAAQESPRLMNTVSKIAGTAVGKNAQTVLNVLNDPTLLGRALTKPGEAMNRFLAEFNLKGGKEALSDFLTENGIFTKDKQAPFLSNFINDTAKQVSDYNKNYKDLALRASSARGQIPMQTDIANSYQQQAETLQKLYSSGEELGNPDPKLLDQSVTSLQKAAQAKDELTKLKLDLQDVANQIPDPQKVIVARQALQTKAHLPEVQEQPSAPKTNITDTTDLNTLKLFDDHLDKNLNLNPGAGIQVDGYGEVNSWNDAKKIYSEGRTKQDLGDVFPRNRPGLRLAITAMTGGLAAPFQSPLVLRQAIKTASQLPAALGTAGNVAPALVPSALSTLEDDANRTGPAANK